MSRFLSWLLSFLLVFSGGSGVAFAYMGPGNAYHADGGVRG